MAKTEIRLFKIPDMGRILEIEWACFKEPYSRGTFIMYHTESPDSFLVAERNKRVVGYIIVTEEERGHLVSIAVDPKYRKKRVGEALLKAGISVLRTKGVKTITAETRVSNEIARGFFEKHNFKQVSIKRKYYMDGENALVFKKSIKQKA